MATFRVISESNVRQLGPLLAGPVRPSGPCCLGVAEAPFLSLESSKTATFLVGSESNVRPLGPLPAGPVRPLGPCCLGVAEAPFLSLETHFSHPGACDSTVNGQGNNMSACFSQQFQFSKCPKMTKVGTCWIKPLPNPPTCVHGDQVMVSIVGVLHTNSSWFYSPFCGANIQLFP